MNDLFLFGLFLFLSAASLSPDFQVVSGAAVAKRSVVDNNNLPPECTEKFKAMQNSTMCLHDSPNVLESGMTEQEKIFVLDLHNRLRAAVTPAATNMLKMVWDENIAEVAQKWAKQCVVGHDKNRNLPDYGIRIGQNAAGGGITWEGAVIAWYNEVEMFRYGQEPNDYLGQGGFKKIGHYTQVVQADSVRLGCGFARCSSSYGRFYICNYGPGQTNIPMPYQAGEKRCSKCPNSCKDGLCDCGGKVCKNGGTLNIDTCTCSCKELYSGNECEILTCPAKDDLGCWFTYPKSYCQFTNIPPKCPYMCGVCGGPDAATPPPAIISPFNCTYTGIQDSEEKCATYGDKGVDTRSCKSTGGTNFGCSDCLKFSNVKTDFCPVMCGLCKGPCNGLTCKHGGKLDRVNCKCNCTSLYKGAECEQLNCPERDSSVCGTQWPPSYCTKYTNVPGDCPYMCGLCQK